MLRNALLTQPVYTILYIYISLSFSVLYSCVSGLTVIDTQKMARTVYCCSGASGLTVGCVEGVSRVKSAPCKTKKGRAES